MLIFKVSTDIIGMYVFSSFSELLENNVSSLLQVEVNDCT